MIVDFIGSTSMITRFFLGEKATERPKRRLDPSEHCSAQVLWEAVLWMGIFDWTVAVPKCTPKKIKGHRMMGYIKILVDFLDEKWIFFVKTVNKNEKKVTLALCSRERWNAMTIPILFFGHFESRLWSLQLLKFIKLNHIDHFISFYIITWFQIYCNYW